MRKYLLPIFVLALFSLLTPTAFAGDAAGSNPPAGGGGNNCSGGGCGLGDWYFETDNLSNERPDSVPKININFTDPDWRPTWVNGSPRSERDMRGASEKVLNKAILRSCRNGSNSQWAVQASGCLTWYNYCPQHSSITSGDWVGGCNQPYTLREVHEVKDSPIDEFSGEYNSGLPAIYNFRVWRQTPGGSWSMIFERSVDPPSGNNADTENNQKQWFCGAISSSCSHSFEKDGTGGGPISIYPDRSTKRTCKANFDAPGHNKGGDARKRLGPYRNRCYWQGKDIGARVFGGLSSPTRFGTKEDPNASLEEAISFRWTLGPQNTKFSVGFDAPPGYYYLVQVVAMDKREMIQPAGMSGKNRSLYPYTKNHCNHRNADRPVSSDKISPGAYAIILCGNLWMTYMPNPAVAPSPDPSSVASLKAPEKVKVGQKALAEISLETASALNNNEAVFPRYARLQHFTPQIDKSTTDVFFNLNKTYGLNYAWYDIDPIDIDRIGAPPVATGPPTEEGASLGTDEWAMSSAQLTKPMRLTDAFSVSGQISNTDFKIDWKQPTISNPCLSKIDLPSKAPTRSAPVTNPWSSSPTSCDETISSTGSPSADVFNAWDDWLVALVVREERVNISTETPVYGYKSGYLRCGSQNEYTSGSDDLKPNCVNNSDNNQWNSLAYTPLANPFEEPQKNDPDLRADYGSMQFAQGYTLVRGYPCKITTKPTVTNYCQAGWPNSHPPSFISENPDLLGPTPDLRRTWKERMHELKWWQRASLRVFAQTNRWNKVSGFTIWPRTLTQANLFTGNLPKRIVPGWGSTFNNKANLADDLSPLGSPTLASSIVPVPVGQEKSNPLQSSGDKVARNSITDRPELNFCRQALPEGTSINTTAVSGNPFGANGDKKVPDRLTEKMPGSRNCEGWSIKWKYKTQEEISGNDFIESRSSSYSDDQQLCNADKKDLPPVPNYTYFTKNPPNQIGSSVSKYGDYHSDPHGGFRDQYWDPAVPTGAGSLGSTFSSAKFRGAPYVGLRPGKDNASNNAAHCQEWVTGRPLKGKWQSSYAFKKLYQKGGIPDSGTPSSASNCNFKSGSIPAIINQYKPSETVGPQPSGGTQTCKRYYYYPRNTTPPASCDYISYNSRTRQKKYKCDWRVSGGGVYQSFGFWYRQSTKWEWYHRNEQNSCHVGSDQPTSYVGPGSDLRSSSPTSTRYSPGTVGGRGATFTTDGDLQENQNNYGNASSNLVYRGRVRAWTTASPGRLPAQDYAKIASEWTCSYKKSGYITNSAIPSNTTDLAGQWKNAAAAGVGWGINNTGPRLYTGPDWNFENTSQLAASREVINTGAGYITQLSFDRLSPADLKNYKYKRGGNGNDWTGGLSGFCPFPDTFYQASTYSGGTETPDINRDQSPLSAPGTCWTLWAGGEGNIKEDWKYRVVANNPTKDADNKPIYQDPGQVQANVTVYNARGSR